MVDKDKRYTKNDRINEFYPHKKWKDAGRFGDKEFYKDTPPLTYFKKLELREDYSEANRLGDREVAQWLVEKELREIIERDEIAKAAKKAAYAAYGLEPDINYFHDAVGRIGGVSEEALSRAEDASLRMRVMTDRRAQQLFPALAAQIPPNPQEWTRTLQELQARVPTPPQKK